MSTSTLRHSETHKQRSNKSTFTHTHVFFTLFWCWMIPESRGSTLTCGRSYLKLIRGRRGQQDQIIGCQTLSVLLFIIWHVYMCICPLLGRTIYWDKTQNPCTSPLIFSAIGCYIYILSNFKAMFCIKLVSTSGKATILHFFPAICCHVMLLCVLLKWSVIYIPHPPFRHLHFVPLSFHLPPLSSPLRSSLTLSCRLWHGFLPLHHRLATFSPFSPRPDGS